MQDDRRQYFRIKDEVLLRVVESDLNSARSGHVPRHFQEDTSFNLVTDLQRIDHENQQLLNQFGQSNRDLETYLRGINKKIDLIAAQVVKSHHAQQHKQTVVLSEGGMAFLSPTPFAKNAVVAIQLFLLPSYASLILYGKVIDCAPHGNSQQVSTEFIELSESNRQLLAKQIMHVQMSAKRQQIER